MAVKLHTAGDGHLRGLIAAGNYDASSDWSFSAEDGDALLGSTGGDWTRYANVHLGEDDAAAADTKDRWAYPAAKASGDSETVFRAGLVAAQQRAAQQGESDIEAAAGALIKLIDDTEGTEDSVTAEATPDRPTEPEADQERAAITNAVRHPARPHDLSRIATRVFGTPLMIARAKLDVILGVLGPRVGLTEPALQAAAQQDIEDGPSDDAAPYALTPAGIAVIPIHGSLVYRSSWLDAWSGLVSYGDICEAVDQAVADPAVKGILLDIDSYGGEANGVPDCADHIFAARAQKPIYAVAADSAYSAAYFIAAAAEKLFVSRTSGVGSIGTVALHVDQSALDAMDGLKYTYVFAGAHKIDGDPHAPLSDPARAALQGQVDQMNTLFVASVAKYRGLPEADIVDMQAACFIGDRAVAAKLADSLGTPEDALVALQAAIGVRAMGAAAAVPAVPADPESPEPPVDERRSPAAPAASAEPSNVVDLAQVRGEAAAETTATHLEIVELCALANMPQLAAAAIRDRLTIDQVQKRITDARAQASASRETSAHIMPDAGFNQHQAAAAGWDHAFARARGVKTKE